MRYESFPLSEIDLSKLVLVKEVIKGFDEQDHSRWIFRSPGSLEIAGKADLYLKVWNPTYLRSRNIHWGINSGFYDPLTTPALVGVLTHRGVCRGYITYRCRYHRKIEEAFNRIILERTVQTGLFFIQYSRYHIMRYRKKYSLIDLEGIYPLSELPKMPSYHTVFDDSSYGSFVFQLYSQSFPTGDLQLSDLLLHGAPPVLEASRLARGVRFARRKANAAYKHLRTWMLENRGLRKNHLSLIEI